MRPIGAFAVAAILVAACGGGDTVTAGTVSTTAAHTTITETTEPTTTSAAPARTTSTTVITAVAVDLAYAPLTAEQRLDLYLPSTGEGSYPLVVIIHGGGWTTGDKQGELPLAAIPGFLDMGLAVASINYRLAPEAVFPSQLLDVKAAIRFLRANASRFDLDADRFVAIGESAGGHLAALLGTTDGVAEFDDAALGNPDVSSAVQAVIDFYGPANLTTSDTQRTLNPPCPSEPDPNIALLLGASPAAAPELAAAASPVMYLDASHDVPPFFIAHGDADCVVPYQQSIELHQAIEAVAPGQSQLTIVPESGHYLDFDFESQNESVLAFLTDTMGDD